MQYKEDDSQFWEDIYLMDDAGWDLNGVTPIFDTIANDLKPGKICIVGCGRGYDAVMFALKGFDVTAVDFAPSAIHAVNTLANQFGVQVHSIQRNIFMLTPEFDNYFDYIVEQTCFCAINPHRRNEYEKLMNRIVKPKGKLIGLWFPLDKSPDEDGPPWGTTIEEVKSIFKHNWKIEKEEFPELSIEPRIGREKLIIFKKN